MWLTWWRRKKRRVTTIRQVWERDMGWFSTAPMWFTSEGPVSSRYSESRRSNCEQGALSWGKERSLHKGQDAMEEVNVRSMEIVSVAQKEFTCG